MLQTHAFVALYTGETVKEAKIVAASTDPELILLACQKMLPAEEGERCEGRQGRGRLARRIRRFFRGRSL